MTGYGVTALRRDRKVFILDGVAKGVRAEKGQIKAAGGAKEPFALHRRVQPRHKISVRHIVQDELLQAAHRVKPRSDIVQRGNQGVKAVPWEDAAGDHDLPILEAIRKF